MIVGDGRRLFPDSGIATGLGLEESQTTPSGVVDLGLSPQWAPGVRVGRGDLIDALVDGVAKGDGAALASILLGWGAARQEGVTVSA